MAPEVKPPRRYDSSRRQAQARLTRRSILTAAQDLFLERGYAGTTVAEVAEAAEVSIETVYKAFRNKSGLVKGLFDVAIVGDDQPIPMLQREGVAKMREEPDPRQKLLMYGKHRPTCGRGPAPHPVGSSVGPRGVCRVGPDGPGTPDRNDRVRPTPLRRRPSATGRFVGGS
jgi:AcrR family transcriptional regulator